jgi:hypothetical protein
VFIIDWVDVTVSVKTRTGVDDLNRGAGAQ